MKTSSGWEKRKEDVGEIGNILLKRLGDSIEMALVTTEPRTGAEGPSGLFRGCYDYHSGVHANWALLNIYRISGNMAGLEKMLERVSESKIVAEWKFLQEKANHTFELPYGRGWLLLLLKELSLHSGRNTATLQTIRSDAEFAILTWLDLNKTNANNVAIGSHHSWLFALLLMVLSDPISTGCKAKILELYKIVNTHRDRWQTRQSNPHDFLHIPSILLTLDLLLLQQKYSETIAPSCNINVYPRDVHAVIKPCHGVGEEMTRLWPVALLAKSDPKMQDLFKTQIAKWLTPQNINLWEYGSRKPNHEQWLQRFSYNSHWTPQFLWLAFKLLLE